MSAFWKNLIIRTNHRHNKLTQRENNEYSTFEIAKAYRHYSIVIKRGAKDTFLICLGILSASFGFKGFLLTNHFIDGGATGISLLISATTKIPLYILIICINTPFLIMGYKILGKAFAIKASLAIIGLSICLAMVPFPDITKDNLLVAIFGGAFLGAGIGLAVRGGAVIDGTEILAIYLSKKLGATMGDIISVINIIIFGVAAYLLSIEIALYSMITYLAASKALDFVVEGIEEYIGVTIISSKSDAVRRMIIEKMGRGVTVYNGKRGYGKRGESRDVDIVYTVITRLEINKLNTELEKIEKNAFVVMNSVKDIRGGIVKKRPLH